MMGFFSNDPVLSGMDTADMVSALAENHLAMALIKNLAISVSCGKPRKCCGRCEGRAR